MARFKWTDKLEFRLLKYLGEGRTYRYIAERLGCGRTTLKVKVKSLQLQYADLNGSVYPINAVSRCFIRANPRTIWGWIRQGWLAKPHVSLCDDKKFYRLTRAQLEAFLEVQEAWMAWEPDDLLDKSLRQWAQEERARVGWRWLSSCDAMQAVGYNHDHAARLIATGALDASKCVSYRNTWWIRSDELERFKVTIPDRRPGVLSISERYGEESFLKSHRLTVSQIAFYESIGDGDCAEGVRRLADELMKQKDRGVA